MGYFGGKAISLFPSILYSQHAFLDISLNLKNMSQIDLFANTGENKYLMSEHMAFKPITQISPLACGLGGRAPAFQDIICRRLTV